MQRTDAPETIALQALAWIAGDAEMLTHFLNASGARPGDLAAAAQDADFLGSVLDFLLLEDGWVMAFCDGAGLAYEAPARARAALPGGRHEHWT